MAHAKQACITLCAKISWRSTYFSNKAEFKKENRQIIFPQPDVKKFLNWITMNAIIFQKKKRTILNVGAFLKKDMPEHTLNICILYMFYRTA